MLDGTMITQRMRHSNTPISAKAYTTVDTILNTIEHTPGGLVWWFSLPKVGRFNRLAMRRKMAHTVLEALLPPQLLHAMLLAVLTPNGQPSKQSLLLYKWLLSNVYSNSVNKLYRAWFVAVRINNAAMVNTANVSTTPIITQ